MVCQKYDEISNGKNGSTNNAKAMFHLFYDRGNLPMTARDVQKILGARVLTGEEFLDREITSACASDMMSDVLAFSKDHSVLITGLCNVCVIFVRRKHPNETILTMAKERELIVMETGHRMFSTCGMLYSAGLGGGAV